MRYLSLFSGIEAASAAWEPLGWEAVAYAEIEPFPCRVLTHRFPHVPNMGDVTVLTELDVMMLGRIDLLIFGSPCQDLSVAGKRKGLAGERSGLFHTAINIARWARKHCGLRWLLWENVPGAFSSNAGRDFAAVVAAMVGMDDELAIPPDALDKKCVIKWGNEGCFAGPEAMVEWSTLDAQWFGVAQRRRRVFALADFRDWFRRPPVLLEPQSVRGDSAPSRYAREEVAGTITACLGKGCSGQSANAGLLRPVMTFNRQSAAHYDDHDVASTIAARDYGAEWKVRRLTELECERLQGFPDNWTRIPGAKGGPRYKALGNSMAVPVINWIGRSIDAASLEFWQ